MPMQYTEIFLLVISLMHTCPSFSEFENMNIFSRNILIFLFIFAQNIDCGYTLETVLKSTHNLCFRAKIRKIVIPLHTPVLLYKSGVHGVNITRTCYKKSLALIKCVRKIDICLASVTGGIISIRFLGESKCNLTVSVTCNQMNVILNAIIPSCECNLAV